MQLLRLFLFDLCFCTFEEVGASINGESQARDMPRAKGIELVRFGKRMTRNDDSQEYEDYLGRRLLRRRKCVRERERKIEAQEGGRRGLRCVR